MSLITSKGKEVVMPEVEEADQEIGLHVAHEIEQNLNEGKDKSDKCKTKTSPMKADGPVKVSTLSPGTKDVTKQKKTATDLKIAAISKPVLCQAKSEQSGKQVSSPVGQSVVKTKTATLAGQVPPPPTMQDTTVTDKSTSSRVAKTTPLKMTPSAQSLTYIPAILSSTLPPQCLPYQVSQVVLPLDDVTSPGQFGIRLVNQEDQLKMLMEKMLESPPPIVQDWMVGKRETVAVLVEKIWYRAIAVRRIEEQFEVYLLDYGGLVTVAQDMMRPLPAEFAVLPAFNYQVCVAGVVFMVGEGWGEEEGEVMKDIILNNSREYTLKGEFVGELLGGRWAVKLTGNGGRWRVRCREMKWEEDLGQLLLEANVAVTREDDIVKTVDIVRSTFEKLADHTLKPNNPDPFKPA